MSAVREELRALVNTPQFQRAFQRSARESYEWRLLKGIERIVLGTTREQERAQRRGQNVTTATVKTLRQSHEETGNGISQRISP